MVHHTKIYERNTYMQRLVYDPVELSNAAKFHSAKCRIPVQESAQFIMDKIKRDVSKRCSVTAEDGLLFVYAYEPHATLVTFDY